MPRDFPGSPLLSGSPSSAKEKAEGRLMGAGGCIGLFRENESFIILSEFETRPYLLLTAMAQSVFDRRRINGPEESFSLLFDEDICSWSPGKSRCKSPSDTKPAGCKTPWTSPNIICKPFFCDAPSVSCESV